MSTKIKRGRGRPKLNTNDKRVNVTFRMQKRDLELLDKKLQERGMQRTQFILQAVYGLLFE